MQPFQGRRSAILAAALVSHDRDRPSHAPRHIEVQRYKSDTAGDLTTSTTRLYWITLADGEAKELTGADQDPMQAVISPDGKQIAYARSRTGKRDAHLSDLARQLSPVQYVHEATTATLILQGEEDERCPIGQSEELFAVLMRAEKAKVEMVLYPGGHHDLAEDGRPSHRVDYHQRVVDWVEQWTLHDPAK